MTTYRYTLKGLDCEKCAARLARKIAAMEGVSGVRVEYPSCLCEFTAEGPADPVLDLIREEEDEVEIIPFSEEHHHEHEGHCDHDACHCHEHEEETATYRFSITGIDCADCAAKLEHKIASLEGIHNVSLSFMNSSLQYDCSHDEGKAMEEKVRALCAKEEPDAVLTSKGHSHHHGHEEHEHHHEHADTAGTRKYRITGLDCADCAAKLEGKLAGIPGISNVSISFLQSSLCFDCSEGDLARIEQEVRNLTAKEEPEAVIEKQMPGKTYKYRIAGIDCADCANKLALRIAKLDGVIAAQADFMSETLEVTYAPARRAEIDTALREPIAMEEPEVSVSEITQRIAPKIEEEEDDDRVMLARLIIGAVLFVISLFLKDMPQTVTVLTAYAVLGYDVLLKAVKNIGRGQVFDEHFLMAVATIAAMWLGDFREAAGVMLFYQIGEYFQDRAVRSSRKSIASLMDIRGEHAWVLRDEQFAECDPEEVAVGEIIRIRPGERIPLDGIIVNGTASIDTSSLTGESVPRDADVGDEVVSGTVDANGVIEVRVTKEYSESTVSKILELVQNSESSKASQEKFITKFSRWYTPIVVFSAIAVALIVSLIYHDPRIGVERACTFLVISCPCALVISIPLSFFAGIGGLSAKGVLVKGADVVETLAGVTHVVMDKTGTLTSGVFAVDSVLSAADQEAALRDGAIAEFHSGHPIARSIISAYGKEIDGTKITDYRETAGRGISAVYEGETILAGNWRLMKDHNIDCREETEPGTHVYVARNGVYEGCLVLKDQLKKDAKETFRGLHEAGKKCLIVSGDSRTIAEEAGKTLGADRVIAECLPEDKVKTVSSLKQEGTVAFVGDGVNDAPVLATADVGIAMGALGSDAAIEAADVVIMDDMPSRTALAIKAAKRILRVANQNIYGAILVKIATLILGALGFANMWMAIFADTGVAMICVLNALRLLKIRE